MRSNDIQFSIVIPSYNSGAFIAKTLDSVRLQTYTNYEVLVTNDGSSDNTLDVVTEYAIRYPEFPLKLETQENKGIGGARNNSLFRAVGQFIAFLDADDCWLSQKLETISLFLSENPQIDVAYHDEIEIKGDGTSRTLLYSDVRLPAFDDLLIKGN